MYFFTPDTIVKANKQIESLDPKVGGVLCVLHCLVKNIEENVSYEIDGEKLRKQLSAVFDKEPKESFGNVKHSYIIFARNWVSTFFENYIKNKVDLLSCAVFFLRRYSFERECTKEEVINIFVELFHLENLKEEWFCDSGDLELVYNQCDVEDNQAEFYIKMGYTSAFNSILFDNVIKKSAADLKAAGQIQTLYSGSGVHACFLLSDEPLDKYYIMNQPNQDCKTKNINEENIISLRGIAKGELTIDELINALKDMYNNPESTGKSMAPQLFGFTNCECMNTFDYLTTKKDGINKIFYGTPGCGKSYYIDHDILGKDEDSKEYVGKYSKNNIIRTTFYQDYSNTDFVGQILPKIVKGQNGEKDTVEYIFNPGPFTLALIRAISNPNEKVALVIEEINRGNAPAIFGDIFQLLDRDENSISEYGIVNVGVMDYLNLYEFEVDGQKTRYIFDEIKIPGNMDIFATMNTSDQNVYTLDTAFTRRWNKERIPNDFKNNEIKDMFVPGMEKYTWKEFVDSINKRIQEKLDDLQVNEDKQIGAFFVKKSDLLMDENAPKEEKKAKAFAYKVLEYLWDDVSKLDHSVIFNPNYNTFEKLVDGYVKNGVTVFSNGIFQIKVENTTNENSN